MPLSSNSSRNNKNNLLKNKRTHHNEIENLQFRLEKCSFDSSEVFQAEKKFKYDDLSTVPSSSSSSSNNNNQLESTTILKSLLNEETNLMSQVNLKKKDNNNIYLDNHHDSSDTSNLSVIINDTSSCSSSNNNQNKTFYVNSDDSDEENNLPLPNGWSINWTLDGRKYYIGIIIFIISLYIFVILFKIKRSQYSDYLLETSVRNGSITYWLGTS